MSSFLLSVTRVDGGMEARMIGSVTKGDGARGGQAIRQGGDRLVAGSPT
jgi:hypothetical protein